MNVKAIGYDLEGQPGWVTFEFRDVRQKIWSVTEKLPVVGLPYPKNENNIPFEFEAPSKILKEYTNKEGQKVLRIQFLYNISSDNGEVQFEVSEEQYYN